MPKIKDPKTGEIKHFSYTPEGMAAAEKAKAGGGQMVGRKSKAKKKRKQ